MDATEADFEQLLEHILTPGGRIDAQRLVHVAATGMPHSHHAGITLMRGDRRPRTLAASDDLPLRVDALQYEHGEGPCLEAAEGNDLVVSNDLAGEARWPSFSAECARRLCVGSMLSARLLLSSGDRAALNFYARPVEAFDDHDAVNASLLAPYAALVMEQELHLADVNDLQHALATSRQIGIAVGILMSRHRVTADEAFEMLRTASMELNRRVRDLAVDVVEAGEVPAAPQRADRTGHGASLPHDPELRSPLRAPGERS